MKKIVPFFFFFSGVAFTARADHITGGEMYYTLVSSGNAQYQYAFTLKLYMRCNSGRQFSNPTIVSVFDRLTHARIMDLSVPLSNQVEISLPPNSNPCVFNPPNVCYDVGYYQFTVTLPASANGYLLSSQVNYRIAGINNLTSGYGLIGATYTAEIPPSMPGFSSAANSSAQFTGSDLVMVCANNPINYSFAATDPDGDQLQYYFCMAYESGTSGNNSPVPPPPYASVPYGQAYSETTPLGAGVQINANTGLITGTAPSEGVYVVTVCVNEIRNGVTIATQRKDFQIFIAPCNIVAAILEPDYMLCGSTQTVFLANGTSNPLIQTYNWQLLNAAGSVIYNANTENINYTFADTGTYSVRLKINPNQQCPDSTSSIIRVYPGFVPDFSFSGICFSKPTKFTDATTTVYGAVNGWNWDFGDPGSGNNFSGLQNPVYTYSTRGTRDARLIVTNTNGCRDTVSTQVSIIDRPPINLAFRDTLICVRDALMLQASAAGGSFSWTPAVQIMNAGTPNPTVSPLVTTTYVVQLDDNGCLNTDSVKVRVTDHVSVQAMPDTLICSGDTIRLRIVSDGLAYSWMPASQLTDPLLAAPLAITPATTSYVVTAMIGGCSATDQVVVTTVPYPVADAGKDTTICFGTAAFLKGSTNGSSVSWQPAASLSDAIRLDPVARPASTTAYILLSYATNGCPKPGRDTVLVNVNPRVRAFAGNDTSVVVNQPVQLQASGGIAYQWFPPLYLSATNIANPIAVFSSESFVIRYKVLVYDAFCVDSAFVSVRIFRTLPTVFVPTAFTPNRDGLNDIIKPIAAGMQQLEEFNIYNRWGQLVFSTRRNGIGWDGKLNGVDQGTGTYIWTVKALDYQGKPYFQKGTTTLIR